MQARASSTLSEHLRTSESTVPVDIEMPNMLLMMSLVREMLTAPYVLRIPAMAAKESPYWT